MSKYIDAVIAEEKISEKHNIPLFELVDNFAEIPSADVVEVVRCKNCKYLMFSDFYGECSKGYMGIVYPNDFCSHGERADMRGDKQ